MNLLLLSIRQITNYSLPFKIFVFSHYGLKIRALKRWCVTNGPRQANLVLIAYASSKRSGEPAHPPEPSLLAHTSSESRGTFRQKARSLALLNGWACAVKICHDEMFEDTNSLDGAQIGSVYCAKISNHDCSHIFSMNDH